MPSRTYQTTGIVIGRTNFGEADRVIRLLTPDHGKIAVVAKGVRRIKSRAAGHLEPFGETSLSLARGRGSLDVVTSAQLIWYPHRLVGDFGALTAAFAFAAIADRMAVEHHPQPELFAHLREGIGALDAGGPSALAGLWFRLRALQLSGLRPELSACLACGAETGVGRNAAAKAGAATRPATAAAQATRPATPKTGRFFFDPGRGGIVCDACRHDGLATIGTDTIKLWRLLLELNHATAARINDGEALAAGSLDLCDRFYEYHVGKTF